MVVHNNTGHPGVDDNVYGHIMVMEIILLLLWLVGLVAFFVLMGYLLHDRQNDQSLPGFHCLGGRLLPDYLKLF